jgi:hypothetical protein
MKWVLVLVYLFGDGSVETRTQSMDTEPACLAAARGKTAAPRPHLVIASGCYREDLPGSIR